ncbi:MAG: TetR/AcrR family transcriptional regulator [Rubripirellula sp.]|nr:TetR/AcrR family transcriptional regulator [Rubripirellula sp.]
MGEAARNKGVSKAEWLSHALDVLAAEGVQGVRIERLARDLGIAKAGFYWHFRDRNDLLQGILDYWALEFTAVVTKDSDLHEAAAERRLLGAMTKILEDDLAKYDLAIRDWAMRDANAAATLQLVVQSRLDFAREIFSELGFRGRQLEMRTRLFVCYHSWELAMFDDLSMDERRKMLRLRHKLLLSK